MYQIDIRTANSRNRALDHLAINLAVLDPLHVVTSVRKSCSSWVVEPVKHRDLVK